MANLIQLRRDIAANWADINPKLEQGEVGVELDTRKIKIGDGIQYWDTLPYFNPSQLPANNVGYLLNNGDGNLSWVALDLFSGNYEDLDNKPLIPRDVNELLDSTNKLLPSTSSLGYLYNDGAGNVNWVTLNLFNGDYSTLTNKPSIPDDVSDLTDNNGLLVHFSGDYNDLLNKPNLFNGDYSTLTNKPSIPDDVSDLTDNNGLLVHFSGDYNDLLNKPNLFNGDYSTLTNKPSIPDDVSDLTDTTQRLLPASINDGFDFGSINNKYITNKLEWILNSFDYDNGTIRSPANIDHDAGTLI